MPCKSDYMERSWGEEELSSAAKSLIYIKGKLDLEILPEERKLSEDYYPDIKKADYVVGTLCSLITNMNSEQLENIVYNARDEESRRVAGWWDRHQEADKRRIAREEEDERNKELRDQALEKLSDEEKTALDL